ncbi:MAG: hypothetical protein ACFFCQ_18450 [Promethearchaeota archaeon]
MSKYGKPIWELVLDTANQLEKEIFAANDIVDKIHETNREIPKPTIRSYVIGMAPNHPTSHHYVSTHKNHRYFFYLGNGKYRFLKETDHIKMKPKEKRAILPKNEKDFFFKFYSNSILSWTEKNFNSIIAGRKVYSWGNKTSIECIDERNRVSGLIVASRIKNSGAVDLETIDEVMSWGGFPPFPLRDSQKVLEITSKAFSYLDRGNIPKAVLEITSINRVGIATASKIIGLYDQNRLAIYDSRVGKALRTLVHAGKKIINCPAGRSRPGDSCSPETWANEYQKLLWILEIIRNALNKQGYPFSIADVEMALFMMGK